jgi:hypothetical protein
LEHQSLPTCIHEIGGGSTLSPLLACLGFQVLWCEPDPIQYALNAAITESLADYSPLARLRCQLLMGAFPALSDQSASGALAIGFGVPFSLRRLASYRYAVVNFDRFMEATAPLNLTELSTVLHRAGFASEPFLQIEGTRI